MLFPISEENKTRTPSRLSTEGGSHQRNGITFPFLLKRAPGCRENVRAIHSLSHKLPREMAHWSICQAGGPIITPPGASTHRLKLHFTNCSRILGGTSAIILGLTTTISSLPVGVDQEEGEFLKLWTQAQSSEKEKNKWEDSVPRAQNLKRSYRPQKVFSRKCKPPNLRISYVLSFQSTAEPLSSLAQFWLQSLLPKGQQKADNVALS